MMTETSKFDVTLHILLEVENKDAAIAFADAVLAKINFAEIGVRFVRGEVEPITEDEVKKKYYIATGERTNDEQQ